MEKKKLSLANNNLQSSSKNHFHVVVFIESELPVNCSFKVIDSYGPRHAKRARTTSHVISSNLHLKSSAKNGGSNWVLIQGAIFTVSIVISGLLSLPSYYLGNEVGKKAKKKNGQNMSSWSFSHDAAHILSH